jgi:hypothetical protein
MPFKQSAILILLLALSCTLMVSRKEGEIKMKKFLGLVIGLVWAIGASAQITGGSSISGLTANRVPFALSSTSLTDSANLTFDGTTLLGVGVSTTNRNVWIGGTSAPASGIGLWNDAGVSGSAYLQLAGGSFKLAFDANTFAVTVNSAVKFSQTGVAGRGPDITAGTAASAVSALALTQTWNYNSAALDGVLWTFTDTSSHASTNAFRILCGASGTTVCFRVSKGGALLADSLALNLGGSTAFQISTSGFGFYGGIKQSGTGTLFGSAPTGMFGWGSGNGFSAFDTAISRISAGIMALGNGTDGDKAGEFQTSTVSAQTFRGLSNSVIINNTSSGTLTIGSNAVTPASSGTRYLCISTAGVVTSSASACSGT